jgi:hypothetical protein
VQAKAKAEAELEEMRSVLASRGSQFDSLAAQVDSLTEELKETKHVSATGTLFWLSPIYLCIFLDGFHGARGGQTCAGVKQQWACGLGESPS